MSTQQSALAADDLTIAICEEAGHEGHAARITVSVAGCTVAFCLIPLHAAFLGQALRNAPGVQPAPGPVAPDETGPTAAARLPVRG